MSFASPPIIIEKKTLKSEKNYTKITFEPDLSKFQGFGSDETEHSAIFADIVSLFKRRTVDVAGCLPARVSVYFNNIKIPVSNFKDYANLFAVKPLRPTPDGTPPPPGALYCKVVFLLIQNFFQVNTLVHYLLYCSTFCSQKILYFIIPNCLLSV